MARAQSNPSYDDLSSPAQNAASNNPSYSDLSAALNNSFADIANKKRSMVT